MDLIYVFDIFGTLVFAISGAFRAAKYELDLLGVLVLATATGVGGGLIRDVLLGAAPPAAFGDETYLLTCIAGGLLVFFLGRKIARRWDGVLAADALGLSVFAAIGASKAASHGLGAIGIMMMAAITATGGGVIRDVLVREIPAILKQDFYATAALAGGACVWVVQRFAGHDGTEGLQLVLAIGVTFALRFLAIKCGLRLPRVRRLPSSPSELTHQRKERKNRSPDDAPQG